jgi:hypothetical protein
MSTNFNSITSHEGPENCTVVHPRCRHSLVKRVAYIYWDACVQKHAKPNTAPQDNAEGPAAHLSGSSLAQCKLDNETVCNGSVGVNLQYNTPRGQHQFT